MGPRSRRVAWAKSAVAALDGAADYIAQDSPLAASRLVERALNAAANLTESAERGRQVPELGDPALRELLVESYRLLYQVADDAVTIIAFLHGARDFSKWQRGDHS